MIRSFLSCLGVLFGVASVIAMGAIGEGAKQEALAQIEGLGTTAILLRGEITPAMLAQLEIAIPPLVSLAPCSDGEVCATTPAYAQVRGLQLCEGRFLCQSDIVEKRRVCVIGREVGPYHAGERLPSGETIVGVLSPTSRCSMVRDPNRLVLVPLTHQKISEALLQVSSPAQVEKSARAIGSLFDIETIVPQALLAQAKRTARTFSLVLGSIAAISLLVGGIGIANITLANVHQRRREVGIRRALGATRANIGRQFLGETLQLTLLGAFLGLLVGCAGALSIAHFAAWPIAFHLPLIALAIAMALFTGLCAGITPALQAARQDPVKSLAQL